MSLRIEILLPDGEVRGDALNAHMQALGFSRAARQVWLTSNEPKIDEPKTGDHVDPPPAQEEPIVEEKAGDAHGEKKRRGRPPKAEAKPPAPEQKAEAKPPVEPTPVPQEVAQQDAEDEAAETGAAAIAPTIDNVRAAMGAYVAKFGMPEFQIDGNKIFVAALGQPPAGEKSWRLTLFDTDERRAAVIAALHAATASPKRFGEA